MKKQARPTTIRISHGLAEKWVHHQARGTPGRFINQSPAAFFFGLMVGFSAGISRAAGGRFREQARRPSPQRAGLADYSEA